MTTLAVSPLLSESVGDFSKPSIEYFDLSPLLIILGVALAGVVVEAFAPRGRRYLVQSLLAIVGTIAALVMTVFVAMDLEPRGDSETVVFSGVSVGPGREDFWATLDQPDDGGVVAECREDNNEVLVWRVECP